MHVHWWKEVTRKKYGTGLVNLEGNAYFTRIFLSTMVFVTHTDSNDDLYLNVSNVLT